MNSRIIPLIDAERRFDAGDESFSSQHGPVLPGAPGWSVKKERLRGGPSDGIDVVTLDNGALKLDVLPTRGMGLWRGECGGLRLGWDSPVKHPVHPARVNLESRGGLGWLDGFNEWLCRCGLAFNGPPGDDEDGTPITLHGRIANRSAHLVQLIIDPDDEGRLILEGTVDETSMFGTNLRLRSQVILPAGEPVVEIVDEVTNLGSRPQEYELLYHINQGGPFLGSGSQFHTPFREMAPRDARAAEGIDTWSRYAAPESGYAEQVYFFEPLAAGDGRSCVLLENAAADCGMAVRFQTDTLPYLAVWKNTQATADGCCTGLEPCTDLPNHRSYERRQGRLRTLNPGETETLQIEISLAGNASAVAAVREEIAAIQESSPPLIHQTPQEKFSAG